jgi:uncharacterized protein
MFCKHRVVLSIDGCGFKGIIPLKILAYLHEMIQVSNADCDVTSYIDLFTSTSASSIFTGALMLKDQEGRSKYNPSDLLNFYVSKGERMFTNKIGVDAQNSIYPLSFVLDHFFGSVHLKDLRNHFLFYSYNQTNDSILTFSKLNDRYYDLALSKVMQACTVNGEIFPSFKMGNVSLVDASFMINNPALLSYNYMRLMYPTDQIVLISIGTKEEFTIASEYHTKVHSKLEEKTRVDKQLNYFRFEVEVPTILGNHISSENNELLLSLTQKYIDHNQTNFEELIKLMLLRVA